LKKVVLNTEETLKAVEDFVQGLNSAEDMVDKILKAARLERNPKSKKDYDFIMEIIEFGLIALLTCFPFALFALIIITG